MIKGFKHKGLKKFFETGNKKGIQANHAPRLRILLTAINDADKIEDLNAPGFFLHRLSGTRSQIWSVRVGGNWRITFKFVDGDAEIVNYEDYH